MFIIDRKFLGRRYENRDTEVGTEVGISKGNSKKQ
jgi:hypothetical protein